MISRREAIDLANAMLDYRTKSTTEAGLTLARFVLADEPVRERLLDVVERFATTDPARSDQLAVLVQVAVDALAASRR